MPNLNQINFIKINHNLIKEPIAIIGSKEYEFDAYNYINELNNLGFKDIIGIDIDGGKGVDIIIDICSLETNYIKNNERIFNTIICMQTLYAVKNPFDAAKNIETLLKVNGVLIFSDIFSHKINRIPRDYWRFTYDAQKLMFKNISFIDSKVKIGITRQNILIDYSFPFPELLKYHKQKEESLFTFFIRKIFRKAFAVALLNNQRLIPEISIHSIGIKNHD